MKLGGWPLRRGPPSRDAAAVTGKPPLVTFDPTNPYSKGAGEILARLSEAIDVLWDDERILYVRGQGDPAPNLGIGDLVVVSPPPPALDASNFDYVFATPSCLSSVVQALGGPQSGGPDVVKLRVTKDPFELGLADPKAESPGFLHLVLVDPAASHAPAQGDPVAYFDPYGDSSASLLHRVCRVALDDQALQQGKLLSTGAGLAPTFQRLARALSARRVGVALAGGGALSYYHAAVLCYLVEELEIPIDFVSGISGGALVGAYFCAGGTGPGGLDLFLRRGLTFVRMVFEAVASVAAIARQVDEDLPGWDVRSLEVPLLAVTTHVSGPDLLPHFEHHPYYPNIMAPVRPPPRAGYLRAGSLGLAVQLSGSAPGAFGVTELAAGSSVNGYLDGALATQVPFEPLYLEGADLLACSYALPGLGQVVYPGPLRRVSEGLDALAATEALRSRWRRNLLAPHLPMATLEPFRALRPLLLSMPAFWDGDRIFEESWKQLEGLAPYPGEKDPASAPAGLAYLEALVDQQSKLPPNYP